RFPDRSDQSGEQSRFTDRGRASQFLNDEGMTEHVAEGEQHGGEQDHHDEHGAAAAGHPIFPPGGGLGGPMKCRNIAEPLEPREQSWSVLECGGLPPPWSAAACCRFGVSGVRGVLPTPRRPPQSGGKPPHSKAAKPPRFRVAWQYGT